MKTTGLDRMFIRDLSVHCVIGTKPEERRRRQLLVINIELACDLEPAGTTDRLDETVNYHDLTAKIVAMANGSGFRLIEKMAREVAMICLDDCRVVAVTVTVDKPGALRAARSAAVMICRERKKRAVGRRGGHV